jgi:hypothetical protein
MNHYHSYLESIDNKLRARKTLSHLFHSETQDRVPFFVTEISKEQLKDLKQLTQEPSKSKERALAAFLKEPK